MLNWIKIRGVYRPGNKKKYMIFLNPCYNNFGLIDGGIILLAKNRFENIVVRISYKIIFNIKLKIVKNRKNIITINTRIHIAFIIPYNLTIKMD